MLSSPYRGSTLLTEILTSSKIISSNHDTGTSEGQTLPGAKEIMIKEKNVPGSGAEIIFSVQTTFDATLSAAAASMPL